MSDDIAINVENLSKVYRLYDNPVDRLKESLHPFRKKYHKDFYALKDVNFKVKKGETVGIIGKNGSGKSTLLKLITGVLTPSGGNITVNGKVSALLELGAGFNPEFTGIENVYFNSTLMGYAKEEIDAKIDDILCFADIGEFVYQPVKTYSSGMMVRLAFAVAINVDPEILIVDEALAVGDEAFQRKCYSRIEAIQKQGGTILFVSHGASTIVQLCNRALLFDQGELFLAGLPKTVISKYHKLIYAPPDKVEYLRDEIRNSKTASRDINDLTINLSTEKTENWDYRHYYNPDLVSKSTIFYESRGALIKDPVIMTPHGKKVNVLARGEEYIYTYSVYFNKPAYNVRFGTMIKTISGLELWAMVSHPIGSSIECIESGSVFTPSFRFKCALLAGVYFMNAGVVGTVNGTEVFLHRGVDIATFMVQPEPNLLSTGIVDLSVSSIY